MTSTGDVFRQWNEYFEDLLNPTNTSPKEDTEPLDFMESSITEAEVTEGDAGLLVC